METAFQHERQKEFPTKSESAFWTPKPHCESMLSDEGRTILNNTKMPERPGCIGSFDRTTLETFNRKQERSFSTSDVARNFKRGGGGGHDFHIFSRVFFGRTNLSLIEKQERF